MGDAPPELPRSDGRYPQGKIKIFNKRIGERIEKVIGDTVSSKTIFEQKRDAILARCPYHTHIKEEELKDIDMSYLFDHLIEDPKHIQLGITMQWYEKELFLPLIKTTSRGTWYISQIDLPGHPFDGVSIWYNTTNNNFQRTYGKDRLASIEHSISLDIFTTAPISRN